MSLFLLRDDDANATTEPERLARAYAPLLDVGMPVSFATIPAVALDTRAPDGTRERFIDERWPDAQACAELHAASPIADWLRTHPCVDVLQHGHTHERVREGTEFGALTDAEAAARIQAGHEVLVRALGRAPSGFVAPWDRLSRGALAAACRFFPFVSTSWLSRDALPARALLAHVGERIRRRLVLRIGGALVARHQGGVIRPDMDPADVASALDRAARGPLTVVMLHHWMFWERADPHPVIRALASALARPGRTVIRASEAAVRLA